MQSKPAGAATLRRIRNHLRARRLRALLPDLFRLYWDAPEGSEPEDLAYSLASAIGASFDDFCDAAPGYQPFPSTPPIPCRFVDLPFTQGLAVSPQA